MSHCIVAAALTCYPACMAYSFNQHDWLDVASGQADLARNLAVAAASWTCCPTHLTASKVSACPLASSSSLSEGQLVSGASSTGTAWLGPTTCNLMTVACDWGVGSHNISHLLHVAMLQA